MSILKKYFLLINILFSLFNIHHAQNSIVDSTIHHIIIDEESATHIKPKKNSIPTNNSITSDGHTLLIKADFEMKFVWIINNHKEEFYNFSSNNEYSFNNLQVGTYQLLSLYYDLEIENRFYMTLFYKEIELTSDDTLEIKYEDADKEKIFNLRRIDNSPLLMSLISFSFYNKSLPGGIRYTRMDLNYRVDELKDEFIFKYNKFPNEPFENEWVVKGKQLINNGDFYLLNGEFTNNNTESIIENRPENFGHAKFNYYFPDSVIASDLHIGFFPGFHSYLDDQLYNLPMKLSIYQDTSASMELINSKFWHTIELQGRSPSDLSSVKMRLGKNKVYGFNSDNSFNEPLVLSQTENITFGLTPTYWFGKYENKNDTIKIKNSLGAFNGTQLFLTQTNDVILLTPPKIKIASKNRLIIEKDIISPEIPYAGYIPDSLKFPVEPDWYRAIVTNDKNEVAKRVASTIATTEFDLRRLDKNPPYMKQFQILAGEDLAHILNSGDVNTIRFILDDDNQLNVVQLFYKSENDTNWNELPLDIKNNLFQGELPVLSSGFYQLKIYASDISENNLSVLMEPAFLYENITSVNYDIKSINYYNLYNNYPNPFNPSTQISYQIPENSFVSLVVYNTLGQNVAQLVNQRQSSGKYSVQFNSSKLPSGVYIYKLQANEFSSVKKMLLLK